MYVIRMLLRQLFRRFSGEWMVMRPGGPAHHTARNSTAGIANAISQPGACIPTALTSIEIHEPLDSPLRGSGLTVTGCVYVWPSTVNWTV